VLLFSGGVHRCGSGGFVVFVGHRIGFIAGS
jgi:hypothetical protein